MFAAECGDRVGGSVADEEGLSYMFEAECGRSGVDSIEQGGPDIVLNSIAIAVWGRSLALVSQEAWTLPAVGKKIFAPFSPPALSPMWTAVSHPRGQN